MADNDTIEVLVLETEETLPGRRMVPGAANLAARVVSLSVDTVRQGIRQASEQVNEIVKELPSDDAAARLDQISLDLNVSADGNVQWVVGLGVSVGSTVTLTFKIPEAKGDVD